MSWKIAVPVAVLSIGVALIVWAAEGAPVDRPDSGYVVSSSTECQVGLAASPDADRPDVTWTTKDPDTRECEEWGVGIQLWYDRDRPALPPSSTERGTDYRWVAAGFVALGLVFASFGLQDVVVRRRSGRPLLRRRSPTPPSERDRVRAEAIRAREDRIARESGSSRLARWGSRPTSRLDKVMLAGFALLIVAGLIGSIAWLDRDTRDTLTRLNDRYVEHIELESVKRGSNIQHTRIVINSTSRPDCDEDDGWLTCSEDPQPTRE